jgi:hypothetical protein
MSGKSYFISFVKNDESWAKWLVKILEAEGHKVTLSDNAGRLPQPEQTLIALLSRAYLDSEAGKDEWVTAYTGDRKGQGRAIIPVRVESVNPEGLLSHRVFIDIFGNISDEERARRLLVALSDEKRELEDSDYQNIAEGEIKTAHNLPPAENNPADADALHELEETLLQDPHPIAVLAGTDAHNAALRFAWKHIRKYHTVWHVNASDETGLDLAYKQITAAKKLSAGASALAGADNIREAVREWLENDSGSLLIFDGAEDMNLLETYLPQEARGGIIITVKDADAASILMLENVIINCD